MDWVHFVFYLSANFIEKGYFCGKPIIKWNQD